MSYTTKVHHDVGGDSLTVDSGGKIIFGNVTFSVDAAGNIVFTGVPTADPHVAGALYNASGVLTVSTG